jgi:hypothetical protein
MLKLVEEPLDSVPELVGLDVVRDLDISVSLRWNYSLYIGFLDHFPQRIGIVCLISDDAIGSLTIQQVGGCGDVMCLAASQNKAQGPTFCICEGMNFGG